MTVPPAYGGSGLIPLSATEQPLPGVLHVDGKQVFQKTITTGALLDNATLTVAHGITGVDLILGWAGMATTGTVHLQLPSVSKGLIAAQVVLEADDTNISIITGNDKTTFTTSFVTLQYTKV